MSFSEQDILKTLMHSRHRVAAAAWVVAQDAQVAEDIFQNVVIKAMTKQVAFETNDAVLAWAFTSARREAIDWVRKRRRETSILPSDVLDLLEQEWAAQRVRNDTTTEALSHCIGIMPANARKLLELRYFDGHSCREVADRVGTSLAAVYQRLSRAHQSLKSCVERRLAAINNLEATDS